MPGTWDIIPIDPQVGPQTPITTMLLLTDGTVMCNEGNSTRWWKFSPDPKGDYSQGTWKQLAAMRNPRMYYASAVTAEGYVIVAGGEYAGGDQPAELAAAELYVVDGVVDEWFDLPIPEFFGTPWAQIGDAPCCVLADGRFLIGSIAPKTDTTAVFDFSSGQWTTVGYKQGRSSEETWVLLPDGTVLAVDCDKAPAAERYLPDQQKWISAGATPVALVEKPSNEIGPGVLLTDGRVFVVGATGHTALYTPAPAPQPGSWSQGPDFPKYQGQTQGAKDAPACLLPNGKVLCVVATLSGAEDDYGSPPTQFYEFDGSSLQPVDSFQDPPTTQPYLLQMLLLPTGQVLLSNADPHVPAAFAIYTPDGAPDPKWKPEITWVLKQYEQGDGFQLLEGKRLNGWSQAVGYGDDIAAATNYPLVQLTFSRGQVTYCPTHGHSTMGVATGDALHSTLFDVPRHCPLGHAQLRVIANGIASDPVGVVIKAYNPFKHLQVQYEAAYAGMLIGSLADGPLFVLGPNGPVPVDPQWPQSQQIARQAAAARRSMVTAMSVLKQLGREAVGPHSV
jgi:hypothetical protein